MRVGLTGGIGSGKSVAAQAFADLGALVIDTDLLAREAVAPGGDAFMQIAREWPAVIRAGTLDRAALARIVFDDPAARAHLNAIVHPHVRRLAVEHESRAVPGQLIVHVVPLLFETGYADLVDKTVVVIAPDRERLARVMTRDRIDEAAVRARMAAQISPGEARRRADYAIENDGDLAHLRAAVKGVYENLMMERSPGV
ncbi:MAG: dephospho-CoA kinase [Vulcanimicrobiaceae bacterium]